MFKMTFSKLYVCLVYFGIFIFNLIAQEKSQREYKFNVIPQLDFSMLQLENNTFMFSPSGNFQFKYQKEEGAAIKRPDVIAGSFSYGQDFFF